MNCGFMNFGLWAKAGSRVIAAAGFDLLGVAGLLGLLLMAVGGAARLPAQVPSGKDVVAPTAYVSLDPAGRGSTAQIAVVMKIRPGFHVNIPSIVLATWYAASRNRVKISIT